MLSYWVEQTIPSAEIFVHKFKLPIISSLIYWVDKHSLLNVFRDYNKNKNATFFLMFEALGLSPWLQKAANKVGITEPSEVQKACIPQIIAGKDCIATSQTGSGKTAGRKSLTKHSLFRFSTVLL